MSRECNAHAVAWPRCAQQVYSEKSRDRQAKQKAVIKAQPGKKKSTTLFRTLVPNLHFCFPNFNQ